MNSDAVFEEKLKRTAAQMYSYHGVSCLLDTWLLWRSRAAKGICPWCGVAISSQYRYNSLPKHLKCCPKKAYLPQVTLDPIQIVGGSDAR